MTSASTDVKHEYDRIPYLVAYQNNSAVRDVYGGVAELVVPKATSCVKHRAQRHRTGVHAPDRRWRLPADDQRWPCAGHHVIYCNSRFAAPILALLMEKGGRGPGRMHQGRQAGWAATGWYCPLERRRLAVGVLPAAVRQKSPP